MGLTEFRVVEVRWGSGTYLCAGGSLVLWTPCLLLGHPHPLAVLARALNSHLWPVYLMTTFSRGSSLSLSLSQLSLARLPTVMAGRSRRLPQLQTVDCSSACANLKLLSDGCIGASPQDGSEGLLTSSL